MRSSTWRATVPDRGPAQDLARQLGVDTFVKFLGKQDHVERLIPRMNALHLPSETERSASLLWKPWHAGFLRWLPGREAFQDLITHDVDGFMEPVGDIEAQAGRLVALLSDDDLRTRMARAARETAERRFSTHLIIPKYEEAYREILG